MMNRHRAVEGWWIAALAALAPACSNAGLEVLQGQGPPPVDDRLAIAGSLCARNPEAEAFPVKIMFIIDTSNSMLCTDRMQQRVSAVAQVIDRYSGNASVKFDVIAFDAAVSDITNGFTSMPDLGRITSRLSMADRVTDYQGALGRAYANLVKDMVETSPAERARSKYVVVFFSDGQPDPQCFANQPPAGQYQVCTVKKEDWPTRFQLPPGTNPNTGRAWTWDDFRALYPELDAGKDYNTPDQIMAKVNDIVQLQDTFNVSELRFHTAFLFNDDLDAACMALLGPDAFNVNRVRSEDMMRRMATAGNGSFTSFNSAAQGTRINFLNINYASVKSNYVLTNLFAVNETTLPTPTGMTPDSDGDGLADETEDQLLTCASAKGAYCHPGGTTFLDPVDTDGDGFTDGFEYRYRSSGFDPKVPSSTPCTGDDARDSDGDGLRDCEERFIGSDPRLFDTDGDRIPDGIEFRFGLNPTVPDALVDNVGDGIHNVDKVLYGWDPNKRINPDSPPSKQQYTITFKGERPDGRNCYDFEIRNIRLATTRGFTPAARGLNTIKLTFMQGRLNDSRDFGNARVACVKARFVAPDLKQPANGTITLTDADFYGPTDAALKCVGPEPAPRPTEP